MSLLGETAPDFSDPLGLLAACHGRMRSFCDLLERLPDWLERNGLDDDASAGVQRVLRYFEQAAPLHHQDEEQDLLPLLRAQPGNAGLVDRLLAEHEQLEQTWQRLAPLLQRLPETRFEPALAETIADFCTAYRRHIALEDTEILPLAHATLSTEQLAVMGTHMARRRGVQPRSKTR